MIHVAIIDDDPMVLNLISLILRDEQFKVTTISSASQALTLLPQTVPDVICCDLMMPGMSGIDFLKARQQESVLVDVPVIIISGSGSEHLFQQAERLGSFDILIKPFNSEKLITAIQTAVYPIPANFR